MFREDWSEIEHISYILWGDDSERLSRHMAMLTAYFDESRMDHGKPYPVIGGCVAPVENWIALSTAWRDVLRHAGLQSFHAKDCWANKQEFSDRGRWSRKAKERLVQHLLDLIRDHVTLSIVTAIDNEAYVELTAKARADAAASAGQTRVP